MLTRIGIVNRGDSFRRRRSRSSSLIPPTSPMKPAAEEAAKSTNSNGPTDSYTVCMLGAPGVGKAALLSQFRTSECINAYDGGRGKRDFLYLYKSLNYLISSTGVYIPERLHIITNNILFAKLTNRKKI